MLSYSQNARLALLLRGCAQLAHDCALRGFLQSQGPVLESKDRKATPIRELFRRHLRMGGLEATHRDIASVCDRVGTI